MYNKNKTIVRVSTIPISLKILLKGQLNYLSKYFEVIGISAPGKELDETSIQEQVKTVPVKMERGISTIADIISIIKMSMVLRKIKPDIIHSITPKAGLVSMVSGYLSGIPIRIHTFTGLVFPAKKGIMHWLLLNIDRITCRFATHIIPEGEGVKKDLRFYKVTKKPLQVIENGNVNGINLNYFSKQNFDNSFLKKLRCDLKINENCKIFLFVGRIVKDKGINELVEAFLNIYNLNNKVVLLLVGPFEKKVDPIDHEKEKFILNHPAIHWEGYQDDVRPYMAISDIFVFPSYREGFPNVIMQAGAMDLPCIVTNVNGSNEIIIHNKNGIIIPAKDIQALQKAMIELIDDSEKRSMLGQHARDLISSRYQQINIWRSLLNRYNDLLKEIENEGNY